MNKIADDIRLKRKIDNFSVSNVTDTDKMLFIAV